jgi:hypothetical protein
MKKKKRISKEKKLAEDMKNNIKFAKNMGKNRFETYQNFNEFFMDKK